MRTIELEKEVNELCRRHGEAVRYPFAFPPVAKPTEAEPAAVPPRDGLVPLESVVCTEELNWRPTRLPDYEAENRALVALAQALADSPRTILQTLTDTILEVVEADSAGLSLLADDEKSFFWPAISGLWQPYIGGGTPRGFGPCGDVLDCNAPLLFKRVERRYPYLLAATPPVEECLLVPFYWAGKAVGTLWAIAHDDRRKFDAEDLRLLESLGRFASAAYRMAETLDASLEQRRAALALTAEAVQARQAVETLNGELRENEESTRVLFDTVPIAVFVCDRNSVIQRYNAAAMKLWGRAPVCGVEQHCGSTKLWQLDGSLLPHAQSPVVEVLRTGVPVHHVEVFIERPDGSRLPVLANFTPLKNARGEITGAITSFIDITERQQAEEALRRSEGTLRDFIENASVGLKWVGPDGIVLWANQTELDLLGYTREEYVGHHITEFHADQPAIADILGRLTSGETLLDYEARLLCKDGSIRHVLINSNTLFENEKFVHTRCFTRDITDRKQIEEALRESQRFLRSSLDALSGHIAVLDESATILEVNETWRRFADDNQFAAADYGVGASYIQASDLILPQGSETSAYLEGIRDVIAGRQNRFELEYPCHTPTEKRWYMMRVTRFQSAGPIRIVIVHDNITERKQAEQKMQEQTEALADLDRRKDEFLAMLSHELRNPLAPLSNAVHLLRQQKKEDPLLQQACNVIERQVGQLKHLVDDLLEISRINTGRIQLRLEQIVLSGIVERAVETVHPLIVQRRHELAVVLPPQPIWLHADAARLEQVVVNLLTNAAKYTDEGGRIWQIGRAHV